MLGADGGLEGRYRDRTGALQVTSVATVPGNRYKFIYKPHRAAITLAVLLSCSTIFVRMTRDEGREMRDEG